MFFSETHTFISVNGEYVFYLLFVCMANRIEFDQIKGEQQQPAAHNYYVVGKIQAELEAPLKRIQRFTVKIVYSVCIYAILILMNARKKNQFYLIRIFFLRFLFCTN